MRRGLISPKSKVLLPWAASWPKVRSSSRTPMAVLGESCPDVSALNMSIYMLGTFPINFISKSYIKLYETYLSALAHLKANFQTSLDVL